MSRSPSNCGLHLSLSPERFYWSVIADHGLGNRRLTPSMIAALDLRFADELPIPLDEVHAVYAAASGGTIVACAIPLIELETLLNEDQHFSPVTLCPDSLPDFAAELGVDPRSLNLLTGPFEPAALRAQDRIRAIALAAAIVLGCGLLSLGLLRRADALNERSLGYRQATTEVLAAAIPAEPRPDALTHHLAALRRTRDAARSTKSPPDAAANLAALLSRWPKAEGTRTDILSITPTALSATVTLAEDPQAFLRALVNPSGWTLAEPRLTNHGRETQVSIQYDKSAQMIGGIP